MKLKLIIEMCIMIASIFLAIYVNTTYTNFAVPYVIGFITPIIISVIDSININKIQRHTGK